MAAASAPVASPEAPNDLEPLGAHPYDTVIARMQRMLAEVNERRNHSMSEDQQIVADSRRAHLELGVDLFTRAKVVTRELRQFGSPQLKSARLRLPPELEEFKNFPVIVFGQCKYITDEPVELLFLRDKIKSGQVGDLEEMDPGLHAAQPIYGNFIGWVDPTTYENLGRAGVLRTW